MDAILKGQDILVIRDISAQDDSKIYDLLLQIQHLINQGEYTLVVLVSSVNSGETCAAIVEKFNRSNVGNHTKVILLTSEQWIHMLAQARDSGETFYLKERCLHTPPPPPHTHTYTHPHTLQHSLV